MALTSYRRPLTAFLGLGLGLGLSVLAVSGKAQEVDPFAPPSKREIDRDIELQHRIDKAVGDLEGRVIQSLVNSIEAHGDAGQNDRLANALKHALSNSQQQAPVSPIPPPSAADIGMRSGFPALPPLPSTPAQEPPVPVGANFIGCLDRKAFFQDRSGSPFLVDPKVFPTTSSGPGACGR